MDLAAVDGGPLGTTGRTLTAEGAKSGSSFAPQGAVLLSTRAPIGYTALLRTPSTFNQGCKAVVPDTRRLDARFLQYWLGANRRPLNELGSGSTFRELGNEAILAFGVPAPGISEQRRIADFLDDRVSCIDNIIAARRHQIEDSQDAFGVFRDETLLGIGDATVRASRVLNVVPGFAFPSDAYVAAAEGVRLLRGVNVSVGALRWDDVVAWPDDRLHEVRNFQLSQGDIVMGMDRPWIGAGLRIAQVEEPDLPALLLQRVLKFVPGPAVRSRFVYWAYQASDFRAGVESELTGLSIPHLSGDQAAAYELPAVALDAQDRIANLLDERRDQVDGLIQTLTRSVDLLNEYKQSLVTAAVTGELDVTTASTRVPA